MKGPRCKLHHLLVSEEMAAVLQFATHFPLNLPTELQTIQIEAIVRTPFNIIQLLLSAPLSSVNTSHGAHDNVALSRILSGSTQKRVICVGTRVNCLGLVDLSANLSASIMTVR